MTTSKGAWLPLAEAANQAPEPGRVSVKIFTHGSMEVRYYQPVGKDAQTPHDRDELYVVASGSGQFMVNGETRPIATGDTLFVAAHAEHRFLDFTPDFAVWVFFYGPVGGEKP
jgi:mannose-6-phosphate isomerase-like protein (cupin superfamily)